MNASAPVDVLVIGSVNIDTGFRVDRLPQLGETIAASTVTERGGGKGANQAFAAARHGGHAALLAAVGRDADVALADLRSVGVDLGGLVTVDLPTGRAVLLLADAENAIVVAAGANGALTPDHVTGWTADHAAPAALVLQHEVPRDVVVEAVRVFRGRSRIFLNPSPWRAGETGHLADADVLVVNERELALAAGTRDALDVAGARAALAQLGDGDAVVTLGARGALVREGGAVTHVPAEPVNAVDTVGSGDAFLGTLAMAAARGATLVDAAREATRAAAIVVTISGARDTTPR